MMFTTNGFETYFWDDQSGPQREVSGVFSKENLQKLMNRRRSRLELLSIPIDDKITDRYYQKEAIRVVCRQIEEGVRKHLLVMATGTGKTRTASSRTDVLSRGTHITNVLFLADRTALVKQARDDSKKYLPDMSLCNLCIIFAQSKRHAEFILGRFNKLYPRHKGVFAQRVICDDTYAQTVIDDFKKPDEPPFIAVFVDMMDTGIDVPECVNLVFFKKVQSKTKFRQMIGRGTRLCEGLTCMDQIDGEYTDKRRFLIFDYCGNFEFFRAHKGGL